MGGRSGESAALLKELASREWGLQILDEVHQVVAMTYRRVLKLRCHCRLGLTATLVREDGLDVDLSHLIGACLALRGLYWCGRDAHNQPAIRPPYAQARKCTKPTGLT